MPQVINTVTKASPTDNYAVVNDTDLKGSYRIVANITQRDAIVSNQRVQGMLVFVISDLHFYQLQTNLLTWTDLGTSLGGGFAPPIVRYVYLVQDASDAARMGGAVNNTYTTFQSAYTAANTLQVSLGGTNKVIISVGNTTAATVGNVVLTANWNPNVMICGISSFVSNVGNITGQNAVGNGFAVGVNAPSPVRLFNITIGIISTNATGATGNSGNVIIQVENVSITTIDTSITNAANTTGNGGNVRFLNTVNQGITLVGTILTSAKAPTASAGTVLASISSLTLNAITTANNNLGGGITLNILGNGFAGNINIAANDTSTVTLLNVIGNSLTVTNNTASAFSTIHTIKNSSFTNVSITNLNTSTVLSTLTNTNISGSYTSNAKVITKVYDGFIGSVINLGDNSRLENCVIDNTLVGLGTSAINGIGIGCKFSQTTITSLTPIGNPISIDNPTPVTIESDITVFSAKVSANVTMQLIGGVPVIPEITPTNWEFDADLSLSGSLPLVSGGANTLTVNRFAIGQTYTIYVNNQSGSDTLSIPGALIEGGSYIPTPTINALDVLVISVGDGGILFVRVFYDFK